MSRVDELSGRIAKVEASLRKLRSTLETSPQAMTITAPQRLPLAIVSVLDRLGDVSKTPPKHSLAELEQRVRREAASGWRRDSLNRRDWRNLPLILDWRNHDDAPLWQLAGLREQVSQHLAESNRLQTRVIEAVMRIWSGFQKDQDKWTKLAAMALDQTRQPRLCKLRQAVHPLDKTAPQRMARQLVASLEEQPMHQALKGLGMIAAYLTSDFFTIVLESVLLDVANRISAGRLTEAYLKRILTFFPCPSTEGIFPCDGARFGPWRGHLANALLEPLERSVKPLPEPTREDIFRFIRQHYGHPRVKTEDWLGASEAAKRIFLREETYSNLSIFFEILKKSGDTRRVKFWNVYLNEIKIDDACLILPSSATTIIQKMTSLAQEHGWYKGMFNNQANNVALVMKVGAATIVEWSIVGGARLFHPNDSRYAPRTGRTSKDAPYLIDDLNWELKRQHPSSSAGSLFFRHLGPWEERLADWLRTNAGVSVKNPKW